jgi:hypothetical protein
MGSMTLDSLVSLAESLRGVHLRGCSAEEVYKKLRALIAGYKAVCITRSEEQIWYRARRCPSRDGYDNLRQCIYPPLANSVDYGRANLPGAPAMYSAWNMLTALDEISVESGQLVQIIFLRVKPGLQFPCYVVGDYAHINNSGRSQISSEILVDGVEKQLYTLPVGVTKRHLFVDAFLAEQFSRPHGRSFEFKLTAAFAARLYAANRGVIYPSIERRGGMNLATSAQCFDRSFEVVCTVVMEVKRSHGCGVYDSATLKASSTFAADGAIDWKAPQALNFSHTLRRGNRLPKGHRGWSVPPS